MNQIQEIKRNIKGSSAEVDQIYFGKAEHASGTLLSAMINGNSVMWRIK